MTDEFERLLNEHIKAVAVSMETSAALEQAQDKRQQAADLENETNRDIQKYIRNRVRETLTTDI